MASNLMPLMLAPRMRLIARYHGYTCRTDLPRRAIRARPETDSGGVTEAEGVRHLDVGVWSLSRRRCERVEVLVGWGYPGVCAVAERFSAESAGSTEVRVTAPHARWPRASCSSLPHMSHAV